MMMTSRSPLSFLAGLLLLVLLTAPASSFAPARFPGRPVGALRAEEVVDAFAAYDYMNPDQELMYKDTVMGTGESIADGDIITVAYTGRLLSNGKQFDSGTGFSFKYGAGRVIPGWEKGLQGMKVGGKRTLKIPPGLAYGSRGARDVIPPGAHLEFDCELLAIASNPIEGAFAQINMQPERIAGFVILTLILAISPMFS